MPWIIEYQSEESYPPNPSVRSMEDNPDQKRTTWKPHGPRGRPYSYGTKEGAEEALEHLSEDREYRIREVPYT